MLITRLALHDAPACAVARGPGLSDRDAARLAAIAVGGSAVSRVGPPLRRHNLSLSHREGRGAAAISLPGTRVGVDLERRGSVPVARERFFATTRERARSRHRDPAVLWSLKEAAWKAFSCRSDLPFTGLELALGADGRLESVVVEGQCRPARSLVLAPWPGWVLALVWTEAA